MGMHDYLSRRGLLRFAGLSAVGLPLMRVLLESEAAFGAAAAKRAVIVYYPDGNIASRFFPASPGVAPTLPYITSPLAPWMSNIALVQGLEYRVTGSHEAGAAFCLTGTAKADARYSIDSYLGDRLGGSFPKKALRLGVGSNFQTGSDKYVSYLSSGALATIQDNPRAAFQDVFGSPAEGPGDAAQLAAGRKSVLDFALGELQSLKLRLGSLEQAKLDEHLTALRELERRLGSVAAECRPDVNMRGLEFPSDESGYPKSFERNERFGLIGQIMTDILVQALACGVMPVGLLQWSHAVSPTSFDFEGGPKVAKEHHGISHYGGDPNGADADLFAACQRWYMEQVAYLLAALAKVKIGERTLLDDTVVLVTTELGDSDRHDFNDVACLVAGGTQGRLKTGQALKVDKLSYNHLLVTVLQSLGLADETFGDKELGTGPIRELLT